jgi:hypothetical protein
LAMMFSSGWIPGIGIDHGGAIRSGPVGPSVAVPFGGPAMQGRCQPPQVAERKRLAPIFAGCSPRQSVRNRYSAVHQNPTRRLRRCAYACVLDTGGVQ